MAKLLHSNDVFIGGEIISDTDPIEFHGGRNIGPLPTLYDANGQYVEPVNQWFIHLTAAMRLEDLSSYANSTSKCDTRLCRLTVLFEYLDRLPESETFPRS